MILINFGSGWEPKVFFTYVKYPNLDLITNIRKRKKKADKRGRMENLTNESIYLKLCNEFRAVIRGTKAAFYRSDYQELLRCSLIKRLGWALFQNMRPSLWNAQPSFWNTRPSFWGFRRKLKAQLRVCVITRPMLSQSAMVRLGPKHVLIYISWTLSGIFLVNINICNDFYRMKKINVKIQVRRA